MSWRRIKALTVFIAVAWAIHSPETAAAGRSPIRVAYMVPQDTDHLPIYQTLRERRVLEQIRDHLARWRLPRTLTIVTRGCDGEVNAFYDPSKATVSLCYEYMAYFEHHARNIGPGAAAEGLTRESFAAGAFLNVMLHELAHAVFDLKRVPILGREEDAADQVAAYVLLEYWGRNARRMIASAAAILGDEARQLPLEMRHFASEHGLPAQRFFNLMCMSYGKDPKRFGDLVPKGLLPEERAERCEEEYDQVRFAIARLITPTLRGRPRPVAARDR